MTEWIAAAPFSLSTPLPVVVLGAIIGLTYGLLAIGLVLVYRVSRVINFAHGQIGVVAAAVFALAVVNWHVPYYVALPLALGLGAAVGATTEVAVVRRLSKAPGLMSIVATLGVGQFLVFLTAAINTGLSADIPHPPGLPEFNLGALVVTPAYTGILFFAPIVIAGLVIFLKRGRLGIAMRSAAANPEAARMAGIRAARMSALAWALAGALSTFTALVVLPARGLETGSGFGPSLLLRALAVGVVARMNNLVVAVIAGIGLGVVEQLLFWNYPSGGLVELVLFITILVAMFFLPRQQGREQEQGSWSVVEALRPIPAALREHWPVRHLGKIAGLLAVALAVVVPAFTSNSAAVAYVTMISFAVLGLSVGIISGLGGELSLGQFAIGAIGAMTSFHVLSRTGNAALSFVYAGVAGALVLALIALPSLRARGLMLTVTTLGFALVVPGWLLVQPWALGSGREMGRPLISGDPLISGRGYYYFSLAVLVLVFLVTRNLWTRGFGRLLRATRDNEDNARAFTIPVNRVKLQGFLASGFVAAIGGALYGHLLTFTTASAFPIDASLNSVVIAVLGGVSILAGPLLGVLYIIGIPTFVQLDAATLAASSFGWLLFILYVPGGLAHLIQPLRDRIVRFITRRRDVEVEVVGGGVVESAVPSAPRGIILAFRDDDYVPPVRGTDLLIGSDLAKQFGGVTAVDGVSISVRAGEILGLIGPNGAGKTTLFELLSGFTRPDRGRVVFFGEDVSGLSPEARGRRGLIRSFQDASLFPTMTVTEVIKLARERAAPSSFALSLVGLTGSERAKEERSAEIIDAMGLDAYRDKQIRELSTGTRRITELASLVALEPTMMLLDEPSSGIAQRETEALGELLRGMQKDLDVTLLVIEHDIPLIMGLADRIVAMDSGRVIAQGSPMSVRHSPAVIESYLGGTPEAIERSGAALTQDQTRAEAKTGS